LGGTEWRARVAGKERAEEKRRVRDRAWVENHVEARMRARYAGDAYERRLDDGLPSEESGLTEEGETSDALWVQVLRDVHQPVDFIDGSEHFCDVEAGVFLFGDTGVVEEGTEVGTWDVFHGEADIFCVLEGGEVTDEPRGLGTDGGCRIRRGRFGPVR
jgi:hypothetical protein